MKIQLKLYVYLPVVVLLFAAISASADEVVFENPWDPHPDADNGSWSQANQYLSGKFSLASSTNVVRSTWFGTMFSRDPLDTGDTWNFDVFFWNDNEGRGPGGMISTEAVVAHVTDTGINRDDGYGSERIYEFAASFAGVSLDANTIYHFSIINTEAQETFRWNVGLDDSNPSYVSFDSGASWSMAPDARAQVNMRLYNVPEPCASSILGVCATVMVLLRRKRGR